jgi:hypothetical protein
MERFAFLISFGSSRFYTLAVPFCTVTRYHVGNLFCCAMIVFHRPIHAMVTNYKRTLDEPRDMIASVSWSVCDDTTAHAGRGQRTREKRRAMPLRVVCAFHPPCHASAREGGLIRPTPEPPHPVSRPRLESFSRLINPSIHQLDQSNHQNHRHQQSILSSSLLDQAHGTPEPNKDEPGRARL